MWVYCTDIIYIYIPFANTHMYWESAIFGGKYLPNSWQGRHGRMVSVAIPIEMVGLEKNEFPKISVISHWMMAVSALTGSLPSKKIHVAMIVHESQELPWPPGPLWTTNPPGSSLLPLALEAPQKNMGNTHQLWDRKTERTSCSPVFVAEFICLR